jgi:hypothetical protein
MKKNIIISAIAAAFLGLSIAYASRLTYTTPAPDTEDTEVVIAHKVAVAQTGSNSFTNITTATTTAVKSGAGIIDRIIVNTAGAGSTLVLYDNTAASGTKIGTFTTAAQTSLTVNCAFATGLTAVTASGTAADITVIYR